MDEATQPADLRRVLGILWRRRLIIVATLVLALAASIALSLLADPVYEARTEVLIQPDVPQIDPDLLGRVAFTNQELRTQLRIATSQTVLQRATDRLGLSADAARDVSVELLRDTRILAISARDGDPQRAMDLAQATAEEYVRFRREEAEVALQAGRERLTRQLAAHRNELERLDALLAGQDEPAPVIARERSVVAEQVAWFSARLAELDALDDSAIAAGRIIHAAELPSNPVWPAPMRDGLVAIVLGGALGVALAIGRDLLDDAAHSADEAAEALGRPVLARIPRFDGPRDGVVLLNDPDSGQAEAFRDLRTNLRFVATDLATVTVTSPLEGEGKTTVAVNLAIAATLAGFVVLLVDADLRRPTLHRVLGVPNGLGLADLLADATTTDEVMLDFDDPSLSLITAGSMPPNPSELLGSQRFADLLEKEVGRFDLIVVDTPPALAASDAQEVASLTDATLLVIEAGSTGKRALRETRERMERAGARIAGGVLNFLDPRQIEYGYYQYHRVK